jgi:hypothetical protein
MSSFERDLGTFRQSHSLVTHEAEQVCRYLDHPFFLQKSISRISDIGKSGLVDETHQGNPFFYQGWTVSMIRFSPRYLSDGTHFFYKKKQKNPEQHFLSRMPRVKPYLTIGSGTASKAIQYDPFAPRMCRGSVIDLPHHLSSKDDSEPPFWFRRCNNPKCTNEHCKYRHESYINDCSIFMESDIFRNMHSNTRKAFFDFAAKYGHIAIFSLHGIGKPSAHIHFTNRASAEAFVEYINEHGYNCYDVQANLESICQYDLSDYDWINGKFVVKNGTSPAQAPATVLPVTADDEGPVGAEAAGAEAAGAEAPGAEAPGAEAAGAEAPGAEAPGAEAAGAEAAGAEAAGAEAAGAEAADGADGSSEAPNPSAVPTPPASASHKRIVPQMATIVKELRAANATLKERLEKALVEIEALKANQTNIMKFIESFQEKQDNDDNDDEPNPELATKRMPKLMNAGDDGLTAMSAMNVSAQEFIPAHVVKQLTDKMGIHGTGKEVIHLACGMLGIDIDNNITLQQLGENCMTVLDHQAQAYMMGVSFAEIMRCKRGFVAPVPYSYVAAKK